MPQLQPVCDASRRELQACQPSAVENGLRLREDTRNGQCVSPRAGVGEHSKAEHRGVKSAQSAEAGTVFIAAVCCAGTLEFIVAALAVCGVSIDSSFGSALVLSWSSSEPSSADRDMACRPARTELAVPAKATAAALLPADNAAAKATEAAEDAGEAAGAATGAENSHGGSARCIITR